MKEAALKVYLAEFIGTFFLVFLGAGSIIMFQQHYSIAEAMIPIIFGGTVAVMIYSVGHISGAHFNPAVSFAFFVVKKFPLNRLFGHLVAQNLGAIFASTMHFFVFGSEGHQFGQTLMSTNIITGIFIEFILSFLLMFVIISVATDSRAQGEMAGLAIGITVCLCALVGGPLTGASMNPARSLGPGLIAKNFISLWPYLTVPFLGTTAGALTYQFIKCEIPGQNNGQGCC